jgi:hypothetical protein
MRNQIKNEETLFQFIENHIHNATVKRAMQEGTIKNLGYYFPIEGSSYPGWITKIVTRFNVIFYVAVIWDFHKKENRCFELNGLEHSKYMGGQSELCKGKRNE